MGAFMRSMMATMPQNVLASMPITVGGALDTAFEDGISAGLRARLVAAGLVPGPSAGGLVGEQVLVHGLVAKPELNDRTGTATAWNSKSGRYAVRLQDGSAVALKAANLVLL